MIPDLHHTRPARRPAAYLGLGLAFVLWLGLHFVSAHWIVLTLAAIPPVLLALDLVQNLRSELHLTQHHLRFGLGEDQTTLPLRRIAKLRLNRRLDFSWRVTILLEDGQKIRIPPPCLPPIEALTSALDAREIAYEHILFSFVG